LNEESERVKKKLGPAAHQVFQYIANLVGVVISSVVLVYVVFVMLGDETWKGTLGTVLGFLVIFIPFFTLIQPVGTVSTVRREYLRGRWELKGDEPKVEPDSIINPWRRVGWLPLIAGILVAGGIYLALPRISEGPFNSLLINLLAIIPTLILSTIFIGKYIFRDRVSFIAALSKPKPEEPDPFWRYFFLEHALPWAFLQAIINMGFALHVFGGEAAETGAVSAQTVAVDAAIMGWILIFFMWLASQGQVRADVHLGRVKEDQGRGYAVPLMLMFFIVPSMAMAALEVGIFWIAGVESMSVLAGTIIKMIGAMVTATIGCWLGIWWGARRETRIINEVS
jgi:hypothetical protein